MKYSNLQIMQFADNYLMNKDSVQNVAKRLNIPRSSIHHCLDVRLPKINKILAKKVKKILILHRRGIWKTTK